MRVLAGAAALFVLEAVWSARAARPPAITAAFVAVAVLALAATRLREPWKRRAAIAFAVAIGAAFALEIKLGRATPRDASAAAARGDAFDTRTPWEVIREERKAGADAYPAPDASTLPPAGVAARGGSILPLGGVARVRSIGCNEGGAHVRYESDERGFANPRGIWKEGSIAVGIVGGAFMAGACVPSGSGPADVLRRREPLTINLGVAGNGPLHALAGVMEYLAAVRPRVVVWAYYHNDFDALAAESASPILRRYLDVPGFRQGLAERQDDVDAALIARWQEAEVSARGWPAALAAVGINRRRAPIFLQDLVMGEQHSTAGAALRLDRLSGFAAARVKRPGPAAPPDLALFERALARAQAEVKGWGGRLVFLYLADLHHLRGPDHPLRAPVLDVVRRVGLPVVDTQPVFAGAPDPEALRYHAESHPNPRGYALIGEALARAIAIVP